jgi:hypothetical protein
MLDVRFSSAVKAMLLLGHAEEKGSPILSSTQVARRLNTNPSMVRKHTPEPRRSGLDRGSRILDWWGWQGAPKGQYPECLVGWVTRLGRQQYEPLLVPIWGFPGIAVQCESTDDRMLDAVAGSGDVMSATRSIDVGIPDREFADEGLELGIIGILSGFHAQAGSDRKGQPVPPAPLGRRQWLLCRPLGEQPGSPCSTFAGPASS